MSCAWKTFIIGTIVCQNLCGRHIEPTNKPAIFIHFLVIAFAAYQWNCSYMISGAILNLILLLLIAISRLLVSVSIQLLVSRRYHLDLRKSFPWYHNPTRQSKAIVCSELFPKGDQTFREKRKGFGSSLAFLLRNKAFHWLCSNWDIFEDTLKFLVIPHPRGLLWSDSVLTDLCYHFTLKGRPLFTERANCRPFRKNFSLKREKLKIVNIFSHLLSFQHHSFGKNSGCKYLSNSQRNTIHHFLVSKCSKSSIQSSALKPFLSNFH